MITTATNSRLRKLTDVVRVIVSRPGVTEQEITEFVSLLFVYPTVPEKADIGLAFRDYQARIREGVSRINMYGGVVRYAASCQKLGITNTRHVLPVTVFFAGTAADFLDRWDVSDAEFGAYVARLSTSECR